MCNAGLSVPFRARRTLRNFTLLSCRIENLTRWTRIWDTSARRRIERCVRRANNRSIASIIAGRCIALRTKRLIVHPPRSLTGAIALRTQRKTSTISQSLIITIRGAIRWWISRKIRLIGVSRGIRVRHFARLQRTSRRVRQSPVVPKFRFDRMNVCSLSSCDHRHDDENAAQREPQERTKRGCHFAINQAAPRTAIKIQNPSYSMCVCSVVFL